jgi:outer membrane murein-binding lipoprotein Lpp
MSLPIMLAMARSGTSTGGGVSSTELEVVKQSIKDLDAKLSTDISSTEAQSTDNTKIFEGDGVPNIKAKNNDFYIDKTNKLIYHYYDYKWNFTCDFSVPIEVLNDIKNIKQDYQALNAKIDSLSNNMPTVGLKIVT